MAERYRVTVELFADQVSSTSWVGFVAASGWAR
jgi:hypothetical protein